MENVSRLFVPVYGQADALNQRWLRRLTHALIAIVLVQLGWFVPMYWKVIERWHCQRQCCRFSISTIAPVFDTDRMAYRWDGYFVSTDIKPDCLAKLETESSEAIIASTQEQMIFLHELRNSTEGGPLAICLSFQSGKDWKRGGACNLAFGSYKLYGYPAHRIYHRCIWENPQLPSVLSPNSLKVFVAQPKPDDASSFEFVYELDGVRGKAVGSLADDGKIHMKCFGPNLNGRLMNDEIMPHDDPTGGF